MNTLGLAPSIISGWPNYIITIDTEEAEPIMRCLKEAAEEEELRNCHPSVLEAWLKYRTLLDLVK